MHSQLNSIFAITVLRPLEFLHANDTIKRYMQLSGYASAPDMKFCHTLHPLLQSQQLHQFINLIIIRIDTLF